MKKIKSLFFIALIVFMAGSSAQAQNKTGYISVDYIVSLMPETAKLDTLIQQFQADTLNPQFVLIMNDYKYRDSILSSKDTATMPKSVLEQHKSSLQNDIYQINNWQAITNQAIQNKQDELLAPIYDKVATAIKQVAKDNGYTYVFHKESLIISPPADDLTTLVVKKMNLKIPPNSTAAQGRQ